MSEEKSDQVPLKTCFVVGPIGPTNSEIRKNADFLLKGIIRSSIESRLPVKIWRADEDNRPGMITDKLISDIYDADIVIADLSELNPNVFYELGIRHAAERPTIHMASSGTKLPFDNLGHRAIFFDKTDWDDIELAKRALFEQASQALDVEFKVSNPVTQALTTKAFTASASQSDQVVGDILRRLEGLEIATRVEPRRNLDHLQSDMTSVEEIFVDIAEHYKMEYSPRMLHDAVDRITDRYSLDLIVSSYKNGRYAYLKSMLDEWYVPF